MYSCVLCCLESLAYCVNNDVIHTLQLPNHLTSGPAEHFGDGWYLSQPTFSEKWLCLITFFARKNVPNCAMNRFILAPFLWDYRAVWKSGSASIIWWAKCFLLKYFKIRYLLKVKICHILKPCQDSILKYTEVSFENIHP